MSNSNLNNKDIAYFLGAFQSDGWFYTFRDKKRNKICHRLSICGNKKSLPMIKKFQFVLNKYFQKNVSIELRKDNAFYIQASVNRVRETLFKLGIGSKVDVHKWIVRNSWFGAYLAGIIDGDGDISIKRPQYPQCAIRITSGERLHQLKFNIEKMLNCSSHFTKIERDSIIDGRKVHGEGFTLTFYVSPKNMDFIKKYVYPYIQIEHKRKKLEDFFKLKQNN